MIWNGTLLSWSDTKKLSDFVHEHGIQQFINLYRQWSDRDGDEFKWGDEIEFIIVKFDENNQVARASLRASKLLEILNKKEKENPNGVAALWCPEYATYMIEGCPTQPFEGIQCSFDRVESNMRDRRKEVSELLNDDEVIMTLANFPRTGAPNFTFPIYKPQPENESCCDPSLYFPEEAIFPITLVTGTAANTRTRRGKNVSSDPTVFKDENTKIPVDGAPANKPESVHLDAMGFGFGCCALQTTFQARNLKEARILYDQMAVLCPIMMALTAATPAFRGYLVDTDCRWNIIKETTDCRTDGERGEAPLKKNEQKIPRSRYDSIDSYMSPDSEKYNDAPLLYEEKYYQKLRDAGLDHVLAQKIAQMFFRDALILYEEIMSQDDEKDTDFFEMTQKCQWPSMKLKHPLGPAVGWRIEFRPCDLQLTDFDNAAVTCFNVLLTRIILAYDLNLLIPISKVDENMFKAQKRNACNVQRFWFRKNIFKQKDSTNDEVELMTINQIMNGNGSSFPGLIPLINKYLSTQNVSSEANSTVQRYIQLIQKRASGELMTMASWIRKEVANHPEYKKDSVVSDRINFDFLKKIQEIQDGKQNCAELHGTLRSQ